MLGSQLVTYQTGPEGQYVSSILLCENIYPVRQELYFGMVVDRESQRVTFIVSPEGGVEIEKVAHETPEKISSVSIDPLTGVQPCHIREMFAVLQLEHGLFAAFSRLVNQAWKAFNELDFALLKLTLWCCGKRANLCVQTRKYRWMITRCIVTRTPGAT